MIGSLQRSPGMVSRSALQRSWLTSRTRSDNILRILHLLEDFAAWSGISQLRRLAFSGSLLTLLIPESLSPACDGLSLPITDSFHKAWIVRREGSA
jgi:hypothetical protein